MTLSFSQIWPERMGELASKPNYFVDKIWASFNPSCKDITTYNESCKQLLGVDLFQYQDFLIHEKPHTIREDKFNRWKAGNDIHFVINNRTKYRFQFAPVVRCVGVQKIEIKYNYYQNEPIPTVIIDNVELVYDPSFIFSDKESIELIEQLAINDGFPSVEAFFQYFNTDFKGKLIHWTNLKY